MKWVRNIHLYISQCTPNKNQWKVNHTLKKKQDIINHVKKLNTLLISAMAKSTICTISDKAKKVQTVLSYKIPLICGFNTATITIAYLIHYLTQLKIYPIPSLSKILAAIPSSSSHLIQHLTPVYPSCIQSLTNSHTLKLTAYYINISNIYIYIYIYIYTVHEEVFISTTVSNTYLFHYILRVYYV
jgi:SOS-response transcriptional repressor LexA